MTTDTTITSAKSILESSSPQAEPKPAEKKAETINQQEFLTLLVHQLQNQDPLDPMKNEEFAVQLAQFSQLEQLIGINKKLDGLPGGEGSTDQISSMASFLGREVVLKDPSVQVTSNSGPNLSVDIPAGIQSARIDLVNAEGQVVGSKEIEDLTSGRRTLPLENVAVANGSYGVRVVGVEASGRFVEMPHQVTAMVDGFVIEPTPALLAKGRQISMEDITEVRVVPAS